MSEGSALLAAPSPSRPGLNWPMLGQGLGQYQWNEQQVDLIRTGIDLGLTLLDTAEGYDAGRSEQIVGQAIRGRRERVLVATKFSPENGTGSGLVQALDRSLHRLDTDYVDIYQSHWPNPAIPFEQTLDGLVRIVESGKTRGIGLSNVDVDMLKQALGIVPASLIRSVQVEYNLFDRTIEADLLPFCQKKKIKVIAYSPLDQGYIVNGREKRKRLQQIADTYGKTLAQVALRWLIQKPGVIPIPKTTKLARVRQYAEVQQFSLTHQDMVLIDRNIAEQVQMIAADEIDVSPHGQGDRQVYRTLKQALENRLGHVPSPASLAESISRQPHIKPVRLRRKIHGSNKNPYDLIEGRLRYWAWIIAQGWNPIPCLVRLD